MVVCRGDALAYFTTSRMGARFGSYQHMRTNVIFINRKTMKTHEANDLMARMKLAKSAHIQQNSQHKLTIIIPGTPIPKQSVRMSKFGAYQPPELVYAKKKIKADIEVQLPKGFKLWEGPIQISRLCFVYEYLKSHNKKQRLQYQETGMPIPKITKPDMVDNLKKLPFDCMSGLVYIDDSQICYERDIRKYFGEEAFTLIVIEPLFVKV